MAHDRPSYQLETLAVHAGRAADAATGAVTPSLTLSTTFERAADGTFPHQHIYTRSSNPNRDALEAALAALEGGTAALAFASGQAATAALLQTLSAGDHVLLPDDLYHGTRFLVTTVLARWGLTAAFVDMTDLNAVQQAFTPRTALIWVETPSNPLLKIVDIERVAHLAHEHGALCAVDNTWATPVLQQPLLRRADVVMHSTTKYIGGHSDVLGGALIVGTHTDPTLLERLRAVQTLSGAVPAPFDCWLLLRSIPTLPLRVRAQTASAARVAAFLDQHPAVERVYYPGLATHPDHTVARQQMRDFGAMLSFQVRGDSEQAMAVAAKVRLFTRATSLGGVESLIEHRASIEGPTTRTPANLLRVSIGLEHEQDLIADLAQALD